MTKPQRTRISILFLIGKRGDMAETRDYIHAYPPIIRGIAGKKLIGYASIVYGIYTGISPPDI
jgi:hypothetical protein